MNRRADNVQSRQLCPQYRTRMGSIGTADTVYLRRAGRMIPRLPLGVKPPRQGRSGAAENDPTRHFDTENCRTAKGSLDHLVGGHLHDQRQCEAESFGGLEIDDQLEFFGLLNREIDGRR